MYVDQQEKAAEPDIEFPRGQVSGEYLRQVEELETLHNNLDALEMRLRLGGVLRSIETEPGEKSDKDLREIKVPLAEKFEDNNRLIAKATSRVRDLIDLIEV
jgi:hypothetical protein